MQDQFRKDQQLGKEMRQQEQVSVFDVLGYDSLTKGPFKNVQISTSNNEISQGGQALVSTGTTITVSLYDQCCWDLHQSGIIFTAELHNGFVEDGLSLLEAVQVSICGRSVQATTNSRYLQRQLLYTMPKKKLIKYAQGLGLKLDDNYQSQSPLVNIKQLASVEAATLATNGPLFASVVQLPLLQSGYLINMAGVRVDAAANQVADINAIAQQLRDQGLPVVDVAGGDAAAVRTSINANIVSVIQSTSGALNNTRWQQYQQRLVQNQAQACQGIYSPTVNTQSFFIPLHLLFTEIQHEEWKALILHNGNTVQLAFRFVPAQLCMVATVPGQQMSYTVSNLAIVKSQYDLSQQQMSNLQKANLMYRINRGYSITGPTSNVFVLPGAVPFGARVKKAFISFHPTENNTSLPNLARPCDFTSENIVSGDPAQLVNFNYPLGCAVRMPLQQVQMQGNGHTRSILLYQIQNWHQQGSVMGLDTPFTNLLQQQLKQVYALDFSRCPDDMFGTDELSAGQTNFTIQMAND